MLLALLVCKDLFISQEETRKGVFHRNIWIQLMSTLTRPVFWILKLIHYFNIDWQVVSQPVKLGQRVRRQLMMGHNLGYFHERDASYRVWIWSPIEKGLKKWIISCASMLNIINKGLLVVHALQVIRSVLKILKRYITLFMSKVNPSIIYLHVKAQQTNEQMKINTNKGVKRTKKLSNWR